MKKSFRKLLSILLAAACLGGIFAAAAETPAAEGEFRPFQTSAEYDDTGKNILPADNTQPSRPGSVTNEYVVVIPANSTVALSEWAPAIKKGTFIAVKAMDTTPSGENLTFSLQSSGGGGFTYGLAEEQTRRIEATTDGNCRITFHAVKAVTAKIKITTGEELPAENEQVKGASNEYVVTIPAGGSVTLKAWAPILTKGTIIEVKAMDTTPNGAEFTCALRSSEGDSIAGTLTEEQSARMTAPNSGDYSITFTTAKAVTAKIKIVTDPK